MRNLCQPEPWELSTSVLHDFVDGLLAQLSQTSAVCCRGRSSVSMACPSRNHFEFRFRARRVLIALMAAALMIFAISAFMVVETSLQWPFLELDFALGFLRFGQRSPPPLSARPFSASSVSNGLFLMVLVVDEAQFELSVRGDFRPEIATILSLQSGPCLLLPRRGTFPTLPAWSCVRLVIVRIVDTRILPFMARHLDAPPTVFVNFAENSSQNR